MDKWISESKEHIILGFVLLSSLAYYYVDVFMYNQNCEVHVEFQYRRYIVNTNHCKIPDLDPHDLSILEYYAVEKKKDCFNGKPPLIESNLTSIFISQKAVHAHNFEIANLDCCYLPFAKNFPPQPGIGSVNIYGDECIRFTKGFVAQHDRIIVECAHRGTKVYKDLFSFVPNIGIRRNTRSDNGVPNVILFGLDGLSRSNFHRHMRKTEDILQKIGAIEMFGYHKVAINSFPNLLALLTGATKAELKKNCWPSKASLMDNCPFIWKAYEAKGYITGYVEDSYYQASFDYPFGGFSEQPTDYFWRPFVPASTLLKVELTDKNKTLCAGARRLFDLCLEYFDKFTATMLTLDQPYFLLFWSESETHFHLNTPSLIDENVAQSLSNLHRSGGLNNTILLFLSDHGHRFGGFRHSYQGFLEDKLPVFYIYIPQWFQLQYPNKLQHLRHHIQQLTTPFDVYETMLDLLDVKTGSRNESQKKRGQSLFSPPLIDRSCDSAGIQPLHCACLLSEELPVTTPDIPNAAKLIVSEINSKLSKEKKCAEIFLKTIIRAQRVTPQITGFFDYIVVVATQPGNATYEAMVRRESVEKSHTLRIIDEIIRTSLYGDQSACIEDQSLKPYCYCTHQSSNLTIQSTTIR